MRKSYEFSEYPIELADLGVNPVIRHLLETCKLVDITEWKDIQVDDVILDLENQTLGVVESTTPHFVVYKNRSYSEGMTSVMSRIGGGAYVIIGCFPR